MSLFEVFLRNVNAYKDSENSIVSNFINIISKALSKIDIEGEITNALENTEIDLLISPESYGKAFNSADEERKAELIKNVMIVTSSPDCPFGVLTGYKNDGKIGYMAFLITPTYERVPCEIRFSMFVTSILKSLQSIGVIGKNLSSEEIHLLAMESLGLNR